MAGKKYDSGKPRWSLLPPELEFWARVNDKHGLIPWNMLPDENGDLCLQTVWGALCERWGDPNTFLEGVVRVMTHGAEKYGDHNWKDVQYRRYYNAYRRHLNGGWFSGDWSYDKDSGEHHLLHAGACVLIMRGLTFLKDGDDI